MQQYFVNDPLKTGDIYVFTKEQAHHAGDVLHMDHERIRLVYDGIAFFAETFYDERILKAHVLEQDSHVNELNTKIHLAMALIRREKFELVLQKAAELGVYDVIPMISERCIIQIKPEKREKVLTRWQAILQEAAEQCKRNQIPAIRNFASIKNAVEWKSELNLVPYEKESVQSNRISSLYHGQKSVTVIIGPEGGFSSQEIEALSDSGYESITLGSRILRAETAAIYACSVLAEVTEGDSRK